ncbi:MAG TPA: hypothetical protein V6D22_04745 [Candidatus Obscuribacterales bacterium]
MPSSPNFERLYQLAEAQHGFFASSQAKLLGYSQQLQSYYASRGDWLRRARGIFRLKHYPAPLLQDDLYVTYLWTCNREAKPEGVYSHGTALYLHELTTYVPPLFDISVPKHFRRHSDPPFRVQLYKRNLEEKHCDTIRGLRVTKPLRTIIDLAQSRTIDREYIEDALKAAMSKMMITHSQIKNASLAPAERRAFVQLLEAIHYEKVSEIRE